MNRRAFLALGLLTAACGRAPTPPAIVSQQPPVATATAATPSARPARQPAPAPRLDDGALQRELDAFLKEQRGNFGVAIRDLEGPVQASFEADDRYPLGSLYKLPLMAEVMRQAKIGRIQLGQLIRTLPEYEFGEPQGGVPPSTKLSVEDALTAMVAVSSNAAALALIDLVQPDELNAAPSRFGMTNTAIDVASVGTKGRYEIDARSSARDVLRLLVKLDREQLVSPEHDRKMTDLLMKQKIADRIPVLLPPDVLIAHKTADLDGFTHDAGIVYLAGRPFAIAVLAQGLNPTDGKAAVSEVARIAFEYFRTR
jgi:beta-lactamase class A